MVPARAARCASRAVPAAAIAPRLAASCSMAVASEPSRAARSTVEAKAPCSSMNAFRSAVHRDRRSARAPARPSSSERRRTMSSAMVSSSLPRRSTSAWWAAWSPTAASMAVELGPGLGQSGVEVRVIVDHGQRLEGAPGFTDGHLQALALLAPGHRVDLGGLELVVTRRVLGEGGRVRVVGGPTGRARSVRRPDARPTVRPARPATGPRSSASRTAACVLGGGGRREFGRRGGPDVSSASWRERSAARSRSSRSTAATASGRAATRSEAHGQRRLGGLAEPGGRHLGLDGRAERLGAGRQSGLDRLQVPGPVLELGVDGIGPLQGGRVGGDGGGQSGRRGRGVEVGRVVGARPSGCRPPPAGDCCRGGQRRVTRSTASRQAARVPPRVATAAARSRSRAMAASAMAWSGNARAAAVSAPPLAPPDRSGLRSRSAGSGWPHDG